MPDIFKNPIDFWKNFRLGSELQVAGSFIYNGLYFFDRIEHLHYEHDCFEFLYQISVGVERLEKIAIVLLEHSEERDQDEFEKSLITHNQLELYNRIKKARPLKIGKTHVKFFQLLTEFYKTTRYDRFNLSSVYKPNQDREQLVSFIETELSISINSSSFMTTLIDDRIKNFIGRVVGKIVTELYSLIREQANELQLYTYEIPYGTKAFKVFVSKEFSFETEKLVQKELLVFLMNQQAGNPYVDYIRSIEPLKLEMYDLDHYVSFLFDYYQKTDIVDEVTHHYEENSFDKMRFTVVNSLGTGLSFDDEENDFEY